MSTNETSKTTHSNYLRYDGNGNVLTVTDPAGNKTTYAYDKNNRPVKVIDALNNAVTVTYDANGNVATVTTAEGNTVTYAYDALNRLASVTDAEGGVTHYAYDAEGNQTGETDALAYTTSMTYDALGNLLTRTDKNGNIWSYTYDADGRLTQETDPLGRKTAYVYDANGNLTKVTTPLGNVTTYTYDEMDRRIGEITPMGYTTTYLYNDMGHMVGMVNRDGSSIYSTYDANGNILSMTDELGNTKTYTYNKANQLISETNALGATTKYAYDLAGNQISITDALGGKTLWEYDSCGNLLKQRDAIGNTTYFRYNKDGRCISIIDANGGEFVAEYDNNGNVIKTTDPNGNVTKFFYDSRNQMVRYIDAEGYNHTREYDGNGNLIKEVDGNGNIIKYIYDPLGRLVEKNNSQGNDTRIKYNADGHITETVNEENAVTSYSYDAGSRITTMTDALGHVTAFEYDAMDRVTKVTDALNNATTYTYDAAGNITSSTDAKGVTTTYTYDANGNLLTVTDAAGTVTYAYDALDQAVSVTDRNGNTQSFTYDAAGRIVKVTDKNGNETAYTYDGNGNIVKTTDALGTDVLFEYNANDQLIKMTQNRVDSFNEQSETLVTLYEYDGRNLVTKVVRSDNNQELYSYDGNGNMISKTDGDGYVTEYTYNSLDLISHINYNDTKEVTYQYNKVGELVKMDDWLGTTTFEVDLLGQLKKVTDHKGKVVSYAYDAVGNQTSVTYPDETTVTKTYDAVYNLTKVTDAESQNYTYVYDDAGRVTKLTYPNGWVEDYTYDAEGNLLKTVDTDPFHNNKKSTKYEYRYDAEGNLVSEYKRDTTASNRALTTTYTYDGLNRVISAHEEAVGHNTTRTYLYDTLGNLIREEQDGCVEYKYNGFALDESKKCGTIPNSIGTSYWEYTYDGRGNLVSNDKYTRTTSGMAWQNEETYVYDETNHMVDGKNEKGEHSLYTYNGLGLRVGRELIMQDNTHGYTDFHDETPSVETGLNKPEVAVESYVIDYTSPTFRTLTMEEEGGFDYRWVYGLDKLSVKITSEGTNWWGQNVKQDILKDYLHQDRLGNTTNLTDKFGRVVGRADYNEWGEVTYKDALDITSAYRRIYPQLNYTGHDWDDVLEMYYAKARFYDPDAKRFVEIDPVKGQVTDPLSLVSYLYCVDNPLRYTDPLGQYPTTWLDPLFSSMRGHQGNISEINLDLGVSSIIDFGGNNGSLIHHQIAQFLTGYFLLTNGHREIRLEYTFQVNNPNYTRADVIFRHKSTNKYCALEIKPEQYLGNTKKGKLKASHKHAREQLKGYIQQLQCEFKAKGLPNSVIELDTSPGYVWDLPFKERKILETPRKIEYMYLFDHGDGIIGYKVVTVRKKDQEKKEFELNSASQNVLDQYNDGTLGFTPVFLLDEDNAAPRFVRAAFKDEDAPVTDIQDLRDARDHIDEMREDSRRKMAEAYSIVGTGLIAVAAIGTLGYLVGTIGVALAPAGAGAAVTGTGTATAGMGAVATGTGTAAAGTGVATSKIITVTFSTLEKAAAVVLVTTAGYKYQNSWIGKNGITSFSPTSYRNNFTSSQPFGVIKSREGYYYVAEL